MPGSDLQTAPAVTHPDSQEKALHDDIREALIFPLREAVEKFIERELERLSDNINSRADSIMGFEWHADSINSDERIIKRRIRQVTLEIERRIDRERMKEIAAERGAAVNEYNQSANADSFSKVLGVDLFSGSSGKRIRQQLRDFSQDTLSLIKGIQSDTIDKLEDDLIEGLRSGQRVEQLQDTIQRRMGISDRRARLIARDQVGKLNGRLNKIRQEKIGVERYKWWTVLDEDVRPSHRIKHASVFHWNDPPADTGHPGDDIQCRCNARAIVSDVRQGLQGQLQNQV